MTEVPTANEPQRPLATVISLDTYRKAVEAALFLRGDYKNPAWLREIRAEVAEDGTMRVLVVLNYQTPLISRCIATKVDNFPVRQYVRVR